MKKKQKNQLFQPARALELKNFDTPIAATAVPAMSFLAAQPLNLVVTGDTANDRTGRKLMMKSFYMRYSFTNITAAGGQQVRILVVYDKQPNGVLAAITDVLTVNDIDALNNLNNSQRFVTVCDYMSPISSAGGNNTLISDVIYKKLNLETVYGTSTGAIADINTGALLCFVAQNGGAAVSTVIKYKARIRFADP